MNRVLQYLSAEAVAEGGVAVAAGSGPADDGELLDAYSSAVVRAAKAVSPAVVNIRLAAQ